MIPSSFILHHSYPPPYLSLHHLLIHYHSCILSYSNIQLTHFISPLFHTPFPSPYSTTHTHHHLLIHYHSCILSSSNIQLTHFISPLFHTPFPSPYPPYFLSLHHHVPIPLSMFPHAFLLLICPPSPPSPSNPFHTRFMPTSSSRFHTHHHILPCFLSLHHTMHSY